MKNLHEKDDATNEYNNSKRVISEEDKYVQCAHAYVCSFYLCFACAVMCYILLKKLF